MSNLVIMLAQGEAGGGVTPTAVLLIAFVFFLIGAVAAVIAQRMITKQTMASAKAEAAAVIERSKEEAKNESERIRLEAERSALAKKEKFDSEIEAARGEIRDNERRLSKREDMFDRKEETLAVKERTLSETAETLKTREAGIAEREAEMTRLREQQADRLQEIAQMSREDAKRELLGRVEEQSRLDIAKVVRAIEEQAEVEAKDKAREITLMAVQRYA
ncbi:MAG: Rnase Y domain-containing protein, partial [Phycisphaerales bacterium]|nr:Rnase Y domain-containing protein [Phycisphaerales bacterium]